MKFLVVLPFLVTAALAWPAGGQVSFEWNGRFGKRGLFGQAEQLAWHDFGAGPQLCAAYHIGFSGMQFGRVTAFGWEPLGPIYQGTMNDLISFNAGSGPILYATGNITENSNNLTGVFKWTGTQWVATGLAGGDIDDLIVFDFGAGPRLCTYRGQTGLWTYDGTTWSSIPNSVSPLTLSGASSFVAFNDGTGTRLFMATSNVVLKWTGTTWQTIGTVTSPVSALEVFDDGTGPKLYAAGGFSQINGTAAASVARWNGNSWSSVGTGLTNQSGTTSVSELRTVAGPSPMLVAAGVFTNAGATNLQAFAAWNGTNWSALATSVLDENGVPGIGTCLAVSQGPGPATLFVGGKFDTIDNVVAHHVSSRPPAGGWSGVPASANGPSAPSVTAVTVFDSGGGPELVVAGGFSSVGGTVTNYIARWNGVAWQPLGGGVQGEVVSMTPWNDGTSTALYVAGQFSSAGGVSCSNIAKWNGTTWAPLGTGLFSLGQPAVWDLMALDDPSYPVPYLVAAGGFGSAGGIPVSSLAAWTGSIWVPIGNPDWASGTGHVKALAVFDDGTGPKIYAAGHGGAIGGTLVNGMQQWNGFSWAPVPGWTAPLNVVIWDIEVFDDGQGPALYVASNSNTGTSLTKLSGGVGTTIAAPNNLIRTMRGFDDGDGPALYFGGSFTTVSGVPAAGVARYRSGILSPLATGVVPIPSLVPGTPLYATVRGLQVFDDGSGPAVFAGGDFATAGGMPSFGLGQWGAGAPILDVSQPGGAGGPAFVHCGNLQAGREYFNVLSTEVCGGSPGSGPYLGLCASDPMSLIGQLFVPLETPPFHFLGLGPTRDFGPYSGIPAGLTLDALTLDVSGAFWRVSAVDRITFQ